MTSKLNKVKDKLTWKKKTNLEESKSQKFSSNGSLLSQNGLKPALAIESEPHKVVGGENQPQQQQQQQHACCESKLQQQQLQQQQPPIFAISASGGDLHLASLDHKDDAAPHTAYCAEKGEWVPYQQLCNESYRPC